MKRNFIRNIVNSIRKNGTRGLALLLVSVMFITCAWTPAYADILESGITSIIVSGTDTAGDTGSVGDTEESEGNTIKTFISDDGVTTVEAVTDALGETSLSVDTDEELIYDESKADGLEGCEYIGTGVSSGISVYKQTMTADEYEAAVAATAQEDSELSEEAEQLINEFKKEPLSDEEIAEAVEEADAYSEWVRNTYFRKKSSSTPSDAVQVNEEKLQSAATEEENAEEEDVEEILFATPSDAVSSASLSASSEISEDSEEELAEEELSEEEQSEEDEEECAEEYEDVYPNNMEDSEYMLICDPESESSEEGAYFETAALNEYSEEADTEEPALVTAGNETEGLSTATEGHTELSAEVMIVRKDWVYFQVNTLDADGKVVGGANGAAIYLTYKGDDGKTTEPKQGKTYSMNEHAGYLGFGGMKGIHYCFVNVSLPGYAIQTYDMFELEGGKVYTFNMVPVKNGDIYLRSASLDGVDILHKQYELSLGGDGAITYDFKYRVSIAGEEDENKIPDKVLVRTVPNRTEKLLKSEPAKYRDKVFKPDKVSVYKFGSTGNVSRTKQYTITSNWSKLPDFKNCSATLNTETYDNDSYVRFTPGNTVYLDLPEGYTWSENGTRSIKMRLSIKEAVVKTKFLDSLNFNFCGASGGSVEFNTDIVGLKNAKFESGLLKSRITLSFSPRGKFVAGYNAIAPFQKFIDSLEADKSKTNEHWKPSYDTKVMDVMDRFSKNLEYIQNRADKIINYTKQGTGKLNRSAIMGVSMTVSPSLVAVGEYDEVNGRFYMDVVASVSVTGCAEITGYIFIGPVPFYGGAEASVTGTVSGEIGCSFDKGLENLQFSDLSALSVAIGVSVAAYVGCGWHGVLGGEVTGGAAFNMTITPTRPSDPVTYSGSWNFGYRVYLLFASFKADFFSDTKQFYPEDKNKLEMAAEGELSTSGEEDESFYIDALVKEGTASGGSYGVSLERFDSNAVIQTTAETDIFLDEMSVTETKKLTGGMSISSNLQYVGDNGYSGALFRIANVETVCSDGKTRVLPRLVADIMLQNEGSADTSTYYVVSGTRTDAEDKTLLECERGKAYSYDYSFSVSRVGDENSGIYCAVITSGPENQTDLETKAVEDAVKNKQDPKKALLECRAENQHLRIVCFDKFGKILSNRLISKDNIYVYTRNLNQTYAYLGTPTILFPDSDYNHWWVACAVGTDIYETGGLSNGYLIAECAGKGTTEILRKAVLDGKIRSNIQLAKVNDDWFMERVMAVSVVTEDNTQESTRYYNIHTGEWNYSKLKSGSIYTSMNSIARDVWSTTKDCRNQKLNSLVKSAYRNQVYADPVVNLAHENLDVMKSLYFTSGQDIYQIRNDTIYKLTVKNGSDELEIPKADNTISYFKRTTPDGSSVLNLLSIYNVIKATKSGTTQNADNATQSDMVIRMLSLRETAEDNTQYTVLSKIENTMPDRYGYMVTGALYRESVSDQYPGIKLFYLANQATGKAASGVPGLSEQFASLSRVCDMYAFYWKADYGAKITSLTPPSGPVEYESGKFTMKLTYQNVAPKTITDGVMVEWYAVNNGVESQHHEVEVSGKTYAGQVAKGEFVVPIDKSWNGWLKIRAAVTKVKVNGKWLDSNEAGYKPYWVTTADLSGDMYLYPEMDANSDINIRMEIQDGATSIENSRIKVYKQRVRVDESTGKAEFYWDQEPYMLITPNKAGTKVPDGSCQGQFVWNIPFKTTGGVREVAGQSIDEGLWLRGFYKSGDQRITDIDDEVVDLNYDEVIAGLRFELCGWGNDAWNVAYDVKEVKNPLLQNITHVTVKLANSDFGYATGTGYYRYNGTVEASAVLNTGYEILWWEVYDGTSSSKLEGDKYQIEGKYANPFEFSPEAYSYTKSITLVGCVSVIDDYYMLELYQDHDKETDEKIGEIHVNLIAPDTERDMDEIEPTGETNHVKQYAVPRANGTGLILSAYCDYHDYKFEGWYSRSTNDSGVTFYQDVLISKEPELRLNFSSLYSGQERIYPKFVEQDNPIITFDPDGGTLIGEIDIATNDSGYIPYDQLQGRICKKAGYKFIAWLLPNNMGVTGTTKFTEDTTVRAYYQPLPEHSLTVMSDYPERGSVIVDGVESDYLDTTVWKGDRVILNGHPQSYPDGFGTKNFNASKEYKLTGWTAYEVRDENDWVESTHVPVKYELESGTFYTFDIEDSDWVLVAHYEREDEHNTLYSLFNLQTDIGPDGLPMADMRVQIYNTLNPTVAHQVSDRLWLLQYPNKTYGDDVYLHAKLKDEYKDEYTFDGWYVYSYGTDGELLLNGKMESNYVVEYRRDGDAFYYAKWKRKKEQTAYFSEKTVTIDTETSGKINYLFKERGDVTYTCDDPSVVEVDSRTGKISTPKKSGTVHIHAQISGDIEYLSAEASYELIIEKANQYPKFDFATLTVKSDSGSFLNTLRDVRSEVEYSSDNSELAVVDPEGWCTPGSKRGTVKITATAKESDRYKSATATYSLTIEGLKQTLTFAQDPVIKHCFDEDFVNEVKGAQGKLKYTSSNPEIVEIVDQSTGKVRVGVPGTAYIVVDAEGTDYYEPTGTSFYVTVYSKSQDISFEDTLVEKKYGDAPFTCAVKGAVGKVEYASNKPQIASVDPVTGEVTIKDVGKAVIRAVAAETDKYSEGVAVYHLVIGKADQNPSFEKSADAVSYGEEWYVNTPKGTVGDVTYSMVSEMTAQGISDEEHVAVVDASTGKLQIKNAGTITVRADAAGNTRYNAASAQYVLTVEPKSIRSASVKYAATAESLRVFDGNDLLVKNKDYSVTVEGEGLDTVYSITGKGNYKDSDEVDVSSTSNQFVQESFQTKISDAIDKKDYEKAKALNRKATVTGFDEDKVPTEKILETLIGQGKLSQQEVKDAVAVCFIVNVDVELKSMNDTSGRYEYALKPQAVVVVSDINLSSKVLMLDLDPAWFDAERSIVVTLGVGDTAKQPNRVTHIGDDQKLIGVYTAGTSVSGSSFVYDESSRTVSFAIEHCSSIVISHEEEKKEEEKKEEQKRSSEDSGSSGSSGGGGGGGGAGGPGTVKPSNKAASTYSNCWIQNTSGQWQVWNNGKMLRSVWFCDDAVAANGKNVWYLIGKDGIMYSAGLVQDLTGNYYSLETEHNGYYGMLRYKNGTYNCNGHQVYLEFEQNHNGAFGAVKNVDGIVKLRAIYGETKIAIDNSNVVYSSTFAK